MYRVWVYPTFSISPVRMHFWQVVMRLLGGVSIPAKYGFSGAIPEFMMKTFIVLRESAGKLCLKVMLRIDW